LNLSTQAFAPPMHAPFAALGEALKARQTAQQVGGHATISAQREAIAQATYLSEPEQVQALLAHVSWSDQLAAQAQALALDLAGKLRQRQGGLGREGLVQALMQAYALSSQEGIALMCLAEAILRIPDHATRDALIRDKIAGSDWVSHLGQSPSLFVNAATWGLMLTGRLVGTHAESGLRAALRRAAMKGGEPLIRKAVDVAMRLLGEQFVCGETISQALHRARHREAQGFMHSYDMLGEAALTAADAQRYFQAYEDAIRAIGLSAQGRGPYEGPGISIKLSALHPRYSRSQYARVMDALYPRLLHLSQLACQHRIGLNIDAEEAERLDISLDMLARLCAEPTLQGWDGLGFVVQAYQKRAPQVIEHLMALADSSHRRLMVRLVKGAYWDSEIKHAQVGGLPGYAVYTRKAHTDLSYLACARQLLAAPAEVYPQFATHNAHTLAAVYQMAQAACGAYQSGQYEFQCLHGMGEPLYELVVASVAQGGLARPCRIYAPVGTHQTLLAYLVRRLLENGANSSFVNQLADANVALAQVVADPIAAIREAALREGMLGAPHPGIPLPAALYGPARPNALGLDLNDDATLLGLQQEMAKASAPAPSAAKDQALRIVNPARHADVLGAMQVATLSEVQGAALTSAHVSPTWASTPVAQRARMLEDAATLMQHHMPQLMALLVREAGKTLPNAVGEVREAIDALRYHAEQARLTLQDGRHQALGPVVCISPWNFPLAIFTGQIAAALAAGNTVLAKPAEQTPLIATQAVALLHQAGIPHEALQVLHGPGDTVGAALVNQTATRGVLFTGSTAVARLLQGQLATRLSERGQPLPLIAETGGQNAMIVDSSALPEQVVKDVLASAFDSAGQRCSALRVLCLQDEVHDAVLHMLQGAMAELHLGPPDQLHTDIGPLIDAAALHAAQQHVQTMAHSGCRVWQATSAQEAAQAQPDGHYMAPTLIEIPSLSVLAGEVFAPVLHVLRYRRDELGALLDQIKATGYGLTLGIHSRIDETIDFITEHASVGNIYVNRSMIGAVVGVQPFGGQGLSGTGPKAGGPLYLHRLLHANADAGGLARSLWPAPGVLNEPATPALPDALHDLHAWLLTQAMPQALTLSEHTQWLLNARPPQWSWELRGPAGEHNVYSLHPRVGVLCLASSHGDLVYQLATVLATRSPAVWPAHPSLAPLLQQLPDTVRAHIRVVDDVAGSAWDAVLQHGSPAEIKATAQMLAQRPGPITPLQAAPRGWRPCGAFQLGMLVRECCVSVNTAAAGGDTRLMTMN
jgi:RHH-type proline utilization regulon transcriptional repressor/proline dehydrogenase/delta 1-pyrroline-5-carboxylate dehydrogenase